MKNFFFDKERTRLARQKLNGDDSRGVKLKRKKAMLNKQLGRNITERRSVWRNLRRKHYPRRTGIKEMRMRRMMKLMREISWRKNISFTKNTDKRKELRCYARKLMRSE